MASKLEDYRELISDCCSQGIHDAQIVRELRKAGCEIGRERVRSWIKDETALGRLPRRKPTARGRPSVKNAVSSGAESTRPPAIDLSAFAESFDIPFNDRGIDFKEWARLLGSMRLNSLSELELFLLLSLQKPWRDRPDSWTEQWVCSVRRDSLALRKEMEECVAMDEKVQTILERGNSS